MEKKTILQQMIEAGVISLKNMSLAKLQYMIENCDNETDRNLYICELMYR